MDDDDQYRRGQKRSNEEIDKDFDDILAKVGPAGRFQILNTISLYLTVGAAPIAIFSFAFTAFQQNHRQDMKDCDATNMTFALDDFVLSAFGGMDSSQEALKNCKSYSFEPPPESCVDFVERIKTDINSSIVGSCPREELIYDTSIVETSLASHLGFTCDRQGLRAVFNALIMVGIMIGSVVFGAISDRFGRKVGIVASVILTSSSGVISAFVSNLPLFALFRILIGMGSIGCFIVPYVMVVESTSPQYVIVFLLLLGLGWTAGELLLDLEAYLIRDWFILQLVAFAPILIGVMTWFLVPESARWLLAKGNIEEAKSVVKRIAKENNRSEPSEELYVDVIETLENKKAAKEEKVPGVKDLFANPVIRQRTMVMMWQLFSVSSAYYGISFALTRFSGSSPYLNFALGILTKLPGKAISYFCVDAVGRRLMIITLQTTLGIACISSGLLQWSGQLTWLQILLVLVGKCFASTCFGVILLLTSEMNPTPIRNTALGAISTFGRVGGIVSLLLGGLTTFWPPMPIIIMGSVALLAGATAFMLPETTGLTLPETVDDAINIGKNSDFRPLARFRKKKGGGNERQ